MTELDDHDLLAEYARTDSEAAFAALVARYVNLVHSTARRFTGNPHHAEEITQAVFVILARKASSLRRGTMLSGWLYQTAQLTTANFVKGEIRRQNREQEAYMQSTPTEPEADAWQRIAPLLDDAMGRLGEADRNAVVLRYFENKSAREVATTLKVTEAAAHKRVNRAVDRLRKFFSKRGVTLTAALLAGAVAANSVQAAPSGLVAAATTTAGQGTAISATLTTLVNTTMKTMIWLKLKFAAGVGVAALLAGGVATVAISQTGGAGDESNRTPQKIAKQSQEAYAALTSYSDEGKSVSTLGNTAVPPHTFTIKLARPNLYRVEWTQDSGFFAQKGSAWSAGDGDFLKMGDSTQKTSNKEDALSSATGISGGAAASIPGTFFKLNWGNQFGGANLRSAVRKDDAKIGEVDCYVLTEEKAGRTRTLWIGKKDFLIRQIENDTKAEVLQATLAAEAKKHPELGAALQKSATGDVKAVEAHSNIVVNQTFTPSDFAAGK